MMVVLMSATFINGTQIAETIKSEVVADVAELKQKGINPGLAVVLVGDDAASSAYVNMKARTCEQLGIVSRKIVLPSSIDTDTLVSEVRKLNEDDTIDGILIQLPLPKHVSKHAVLESVSPAKDVDGFHSSNLGSLLLGQETLTACTPSGVMELLRRSNVQIEGARAVVLGRSDDVGKPQAALLLHANATVTICHSKTKDIAAITREADIVVAAIGRAAMVTSDYIKPGAVVIDVGTNKVSDRATVERLFGGSDAARWREFEKRGYVWVGDVDERAVKEVASMLSPVPGGVGPMTIAMLMKNTVKAARRRRNM
ncbi:MAG TPA: bifunctional 5,10-methylenetetrahydrofolate dehydrogenase/5,10-methenyltetrahydrofolate cyclohydrolase [Terriglobia bacterium]|nr:bifunctional 5,10-methylenetetrahydrofolate dehydrogenase/5,10-methenyltetrahydrofolate cyclohydrolase [Terriglobia bacterium]